MITSVFGVLPTCAPAGSLGLGSADARPYAAVGTAVRPDLLRRRAALQGTSVPSGMAIPGAALLGTTPFAHTTGITSFAQNDGTTLGIHSSGRPQS